jgi:hypothetical protein
MRHIDAHLHFGTIDEYGNLQRYRHAGGFKALCLLSLPVPGRVNFNPECLAAKILDQESDAGKTYALGSLDLAARGFASQIKLLHALGFDGVKLWEGKPEVQAATGISMLDDDYLEGLNAAVELSMPVLLHVADPPDSWAAKQPACPSYDDLLIQTEHLLTAVPGLRVVFPHLLFLAGNLPRLADFMERWPETLVDLSPGRYFFLELASQPEQAREFFSRFRKRILFGTDTMFFRTDFQLFQPVPLDQKLDQLDNLRRFLSGTSEVNNPYPPTRVLHPTVRGLGLEAEILQPIFSDNFTTLFTEHPRKADPGPADEYIQAFMCTKGIGASDLAEIKKCRQYTDTRDG